MILLRAGRVAPAANAGLVRWNSSEPAVMNPSTPTLAGDAFEPGPTTLIAAAPAPPGAGFVRPFWPVSWDGCSLLSACFTASTSSSPISSNRHWKQGSRSESCRRSLPCNSFCADVSDVIAHPDGNYEVRLYLENFVPTAVLCSRPRPSPFRPGQPFVEPVRSRRLTGMRQRSRDRHNDDKIFTFSFRADLDRFDELIPGYMHVRISSVMVVGASANPTATSSSATTITTSISSPNRSQTMKSAAATAGSRGHCASVDRHAFTLTRGRSATTVIACTDRVRARCHQATRNDDRQRAREPRKYAAVSARFQSGAMNDSHETAADLCPVEPAKAMRLSGPCNDFRGKSQGP